MILLYERRYQTKPEVDMRRHLVQEAAIANRAVRYSVSEI